MKINFLRKEANFLDKENFCRGRDCIYHPKNGDKKSLFSGLNKDFDMTRCLSCKRFVQKDFHNPPA